MSVFGIIVIPVNENMEGWEMVQQVKCLLCELGDPSSDPQGLYKRLDMAENPALRGRGRGI